MTWGKRLLGAFAAITTVAALGLVYSTAEAAPQGCSVASNDANVSATKEIKSIEPPASVTVDNTVTCPSGLPTVKVNYTDGTSASASVVWLFDTPWNAERGAHTVTAEGMLNDAGTNDSQFNNQLSLNVSVKAATISVSGVPVGITSAVGADPIAKLQQQFGTASAIKWSNEENYVSGTYPITWNPLDPSQYAQPGTVTATGYVEVDGVRGEVSCQVTVAGTAQRTIVSVAALDPVTVDNTVNPPTGLTNKATVTYSDGSTGIVAIKSWNMPDGWNTDRAEHTVQAEGYLQASLAVNPNDIKATLQITVRAATLKAWVTTSGFTTKAGVDPTDQLKKTNPTATAEWSNDIGNGITVPVTWEPIEPSQYAKGGSFVAKGHVEVDGVTAEVTCTITVEGLKPTEIASAEDGEPVTVDSTVTRPDLDSLRSTVKVTYGDGHTDDEFVHWALPDDWNTGRAEHTVEATGYLQVDNAANPNHITPKLKVTVRAATAEVGVNLSGFKVHAGEDPTATLHKLAPTGWILWSNEQDMQTGLPVTWDQISPDQYNKVGSFTAHGVLNDNGKQYDVTCTITVQGITGVMVLTQTASVDTAKDDAPKPSPDIEVVATYEDGATVRMNPTWTLPDGWNHPHTEHVVNAVARIAGWDQDIKAKVTVKAATAESVEPLSTGATTRVGTEPELPQTTQVTWNNGDTSSENIEWDSIDPTQYAQAGEFTVNGTVAGQQVSVKVTVLAASINAVKQPDDVNTKSGTKPNLPETVEATWDDGSKSPVTVQWDKIDESKYMNRKGGDFTVTGTVAGWKDPITVTVHVAPANVTGVKQPEALEVYEGAQVTIPSKVEVTWSNGETESATIAWNKGNDPRDTTFKAGDYTFKGTAEGQDIEWKVKVNAVKALSATPSQDAVETIATHAPKLDGITASITYNDGHRSDNHAIKWDSIAKEQYAKAGSFTVTGEVTGTNLKVSVRVTVKERVITKVETEDKPISVATAKDTDRQPEVKVKATITYNDKETETRDVQLALPEGWNHPRSEHTVTATGTVTGWNEPITHLVTVKAAKAESAADPTGVTTQVKVKPTLPSTAEVTWSNGDTSSETVKWDSVEADQYASTGELTVNGTVEGLPVKVKVNVIAATITDVKSPDTVASTQSGTAPKLPGTVKATWSNGDVTDVTVTWDLFDGYKNREGGDFTVNGKVAGWTGTVSIAVHVDPAKAQSAVVKGQTKFTVESGTAPKLPAAAEVTWSNGDKTEEKITWDLFDGYKNREGGDFTVNGKVAGLPVDVAVTVKKATVKSVEQQFEVTTVVGTQPKLPASAKVMWSNGDVTSVSAAWDAVDNKDIAAAGTFTVPGKAEVEGISYDLTAKVTVKEPTKPNTDQNNNHQNSNSTENKQQQSAELGNTGASVAVVALTMMMFMALAGCLMALKRS